MLRVIVVIVEYTVISENKREERDQETSYLSVFGVFDTVATTKGPRE